MTETTNHNWYFAAIFSMCERVALCDSGQTGMKSVVGWQMTKEGCIVANCFPIVVK